MEITEKLLVCIAFHNNPEKISILNSLIKRFKEYKIDVHIVIDTNIELNIDGVEIIVHSKLNHPWDLTWMHRRYMKDHINDYDYFMYVEDDIDIPYKNFKNYIDIFSKLWSLNCVPSFIRVEKYNNKEYVVDITEKQCIENSITINNKKYINLSQPYHAFWIMPKKQLKSSITNSFVNIGSTREEAAWYPGITLKKKQLVELEDGQVSKLCYSYHLTNNYSSSRTSSFGKIETNKIINKCL